MTRVQKKEGPILTAMVQNSLSVATPAEPRGEKELFFVQVLGGEKLLKFVGTDVAKCYGEGSEMLVFLGKRGKKNGAQKVKKKTTAV